MSGARSDLPGPLADEVRSELGRLGPRDGSACFADLLARWPSAVGPTVAANAWPARQARDGTVVVHVSSSAWAQELTQLEATIRERLDEPAPARLRFVVGAVPEPGLESAPKVEQLADHPTVGEHSRGREMALGIENPALRAAVARAAALSLARSRGDRLDRPV
jgi:hypothetical protein